MHKLSQPRALNLLRDEADLRALVPIARIVVPPKLHALEREHLLARVRDRRHVSLEPCVRALGNCAGEESVSRNEASIRN